MGAVVEGWDKERIFEKHGVLDKLLPYEHYGNGWMRPPGTTEDGIERQKPMLTAIIVGYISLKTLLKLILQKKFHLFAYYCWAVGALLLLSRFL